MARPRWLEALRAIPRIDRETWQTLGFVTRWLVATRAAVLVMTLVSVGIAGVLAFRDARFDGWLWLLTAIGLVFAHATNNLVNDLTDHLKGVDAGDYFRAQYGPQPLEHGMLTRTQMLWWIAGTGAVALTAGVALVYLRGGATLLLMGSGVFFVLFYTWPLKYYGFGELAVVVVWGPLMVGGGYYVVTGTIDATVLWTSLPFSLGATTVIFGKHIDKLPQDRAKNIRTLPVWLGDPLARACVVAMIALQYVLVLWLVLGGRLGPALLLVFGAMPAARRVIATYRAPRPQGPPVWFPAKVWPLWFVAFAFDHNRRFGLLFVLGLVLDALWVRFGVATALA